MNPFWESIRLQVCRKCIDGDSRGNCRLPTGEVCQLEHYFPTVMEIAARVRSNSIAPYLDALRSDVCQQCLHQQPDGSCRKREELECTLDRYLPLVIEKIDSLKSFVD